MSETRVYQIGRWDVIGISEKIYHHLVERLMNEQGQILKKAVKDHMWNCKQILTNDEPPEVKP